MGLTLQVIVAIVALMVFSACSSAAEAAILAVNKVRLRHLAESGNRIARFTYELLPQLDRIIGTLLITNNLSNVAISAMGSWLCVNLFGPGKGIVIATISVTTLVLLFCEMTPKMYAATHPQQVAFALVRPLWFLMQCFYSTSAIFAWVARSLLRLLRVPMRKRSALVTEEEIKVMIQMGREAGVLAEDERRMLHKIFDFSDAQLDQAMIPRKKIAAVDLGATREEILDLAIEEGYSRIPVYRGDLDRIVGFIYARDLLAMYRHGGLFILSDLIRPIPVVPKSKRVAEMLREFQQQRTQIAIVQDERHRTVGLVTLEDLFEEIVGEIDEYPQWGRG